MSDATLDNNPQLSSARGSPVGSKRGAGYTVYDPLGHKIGSAEEMFVNWSGEAEHVRVHIVLLGRKSVLIPVHFAEVDDERKVLILK